MTKRMSDCTYSILRRTGTCHIFPLNLSTKSCLYPPDDRVEEDDTELMIAISTILKLAMPGDRKKDLGEGGGVETLCCRTRVSR